MKIKGEFILRQLQDDIVAIPVGQTALELNGMVLLNDVSRVIWECLATPCQLSQIVSALTDAFEVSPEEAEADILEYLGKLRENGLLEE